MIIFVESPEPPTKPKMRIISWNVNGIRAISKKNKNGDQDPTVVGIRQLVAEHSPDVLVLQEIKTSSPEDVTHYADLFPYISVFCAEKKGYSGVAVLSKQQPVSVHPGFYSHVGDASGQPPSYSKEGRLITAEFTDAIIICAYVPNSKSGLARIDERGQWEADMRRHISEAERRHQKPVLLCGDLNIAHQDIDIHSPKTNHASAGFSPQERNWFSELLVTTGMIDTFRYLHPTTVKYSYWDVKSNARARNRGWRIDYILLGGAAASRLIDADILCDYYGSDHCPVIATIS